MDIREIVQTERAAEDAFIARRWFTTTMVVHGECIDLGVADGWFACEDGEIIGLVTYRIAGGEMEILSLDSLREGWGIGMALLDRAISRAREAGCTRVWLITTNDNLRAQRFYRKRGFTLVAVHENALDEARRLKPEIPLVGMDGIPLKDELEFELRL